MDIKSFKNIENISSQRAFTPNIKQFRPWKCKECNKRFATAGQAKNHKCSIKYLKAKKEE
jgi:hypothetical protein